jgi:hypothetical protein
MRQEDVSAYIRYALGVLRQTLPLYFHRWQDVEFHNGTQKISTRPDFAQLLFHIEFSLGIPINSFFMKIIEKDHEFLACKQQIVDQTKIDWSWLNTSLIAEKILEDYLWEVQSLENNELIEEKLGTNFISFLHSKKSTFYYFSILKGFRTDFEKEKIFDDIYIHKLNDSEFSELAKRKLVTLEVNSTGMNRIVFEVKREFNNGIPPQMIFEELALKFDKIITALRLLTDERVSRDSINARLLKPGEIGYDSITGSGRILRYPSVDNYFLHQDDIPRITEILGFLTAIKDDGRLGTAINRFETALEKFSFEDKVLDYMISLESIFSEGSDSISYKISMRCSTLIENDPTNRNEIKRFLTKAYDIRSKIIHGSLTKKRDLSLADKQLVSDKLSNIVRRSLLEIFKHYKKDKKLLTIQDFDNALLS